MRIDKFFAQKYGSRTKASEAVTKGLILVNGKPVSPSYEVKQSDEISFIDDVESFVSNGGYKLSKALKDFNFDVKDKIFADIGASTGGFTDCLLQNGAKKVYCIDVGESQLDKRLLDKNIVVIDNYNARNLNSSLFNEPLDGVVIDVSFISLTYILGGVADVLDSGKYVLALIKPQFECEAKNLGKGGIIKDNKTREKAIEKIYDFSNSRQLAPKAITNAPIKSGKNFEYVILLEKDGICENINYLKKCIKF